MSIRPETFRTCLAVSALALTAACASNITNSPQTRGQGSLEVGNLTCELTGGTNFVVISDATYACTFQTADGTVETYNARIDQLGLDLTVTREETLGWLVLSATGRGDPGFITGTYVGASASAAAGVGGGVRALVGGLGDSITLQPLSLSGSEGFGVSAGVERMTLEFTGAAAS
ncbi:MAG: DUF992 domain-containing protein [Pseudomonadota bacterium]